MNRTRYRQNRWRNALALLAGLLAMSRGARGGSMPSRVQILSDMVLANTYFTNEWPTPGCSNCLPANHPSNIWTRGTYFEGALALYRINLDPAIYNYAVQWGTFHNWALWGADNTDTSPDDQCAGQDYIELFQFDTNQSNRLTHITANVNFWVGGTTVKRWTYVDALHMSMPVFAKLTALTGNTTYPSKMYSYFNYTKTTLGLFNASDYLWYRDTNFFSNYVASDGTTQKCYWARGNGWAFAALARTMDVLPTTDAHYAEYRQTFQNMAGAIKAVQRPDGFWNVNLAYTNDYPGPESSSTALFTYGMGWGINHGYLDINTYLPTVINGWNALASGALHHSTNADNGFLGYVQSTGNKPASGQPVTYNSVPNFDDYGVGLFLLAGSQVYALNALPVITQQPSGLSVNAGQTVTFTVAATGNPAPAYQWQKDGVNLTNDTHVSGATTSTLTLTNAQPAEAGGYAVVVTNLAGSATSIPARLEVLWTFAAWQQLYFGCADCPEAAAEADPDGDGQSNLAEFLASTDPTRSASALRITGVAPEGGDIRVTWAMGSGETNALQMTAGDTGGNYATDFADIFIVTNTLGNVTNYLDMGAVTNSPSRYYRVRLLP